MASITASAPLIVIATNPSPEALDELMRRFDLHPLIAKDLHEKRREPKFECLERHRYFSLWDIHAGPGSNSPQDSDLAVIFNSDMLLVVQRGPDDAVRNLDALLAGSGAIPVTSTMSAVYRILDAIVSGLAEFGSDIERELSQVEREVFDSRVHEDYRRIYGLRARIGLVDRAASGLASSVRSASHELEVLTESELELRPYFSHLEHDATGIARLATAEHTALDAVVSSHQSNVSTRQNQDTRTISAYAAMLAVPSVVASIYGMNFKTLPLLDWTAGWAVVGAGIVVIDVVAYAVFRHRGWLGGSASTRTDGESSNQQ